MELKSRKIVRYDLTEYPTNEFVKQRIQLFAETFTDKKTLIYDNALQFTSIDYESYDIKGVKISPYSPNMNSYVERLNGSIRREAFDHFLIFSKKQIKKIIREYVDYYNNKRPHQGIGKIPEDQSERHICKTGRIEKEPILGGLHHHYFRSSA